MTTLDELRTKRDAVLAIAAKHGATNVRVFGSVVTGGATDESDIDFLMDLPARGSLMEYIALRQDLEDYLGRRVDIGSETMLHCRIRERVLREAVALSRQR